jgi:2-oxoacid:acceptor oxidoreductase delta subunit (pyruvate/2-ketoisovalerate family)
MKNGKCKSQNGISGFPKTYHGMSMSKKKEKLPDPSVAISTQSTAVNRTGTWRYAKPIFLERIAPCNEACPAGEDIDTVMFLNSQERFVDAYEKIREENPFPGICGRVCLHPCETSCNRGSFDEPVSIRILERFAADQARKKGVSAEAPSKGKTGKKIGIIGSGPAGLSCAYFSALLGHQVTVFEKEERPGGMLRYAIPEYRLPADLLDWEIEQVLSLGVDLRLKTLVGQDLPTEDLKKFDAVFMAPGASMSDSIPGVRDPVQGVHRALDFLRGTKEGNRFALKGPVMIVGGGNTAIDAARAALRLGGQPLVLYRRSREEMPATEEEILQAEREGVVFNYLTSVYGIVEEKGRVEAVSCIKTELGEKDENGRRVFRPLEGKDFELTAEHVIFAVGQRPDLSFLPGRIRRESGMIAVDSSLETGMKGTFAGGDAIDQPRTVVHAIGAGKRGAMAIDLFLKKESPDMLTEMAVGSKGSLSMAAYRNPEELRGRLMKEVVPYEALNLYDFRKSPRVQAPALSRKEALRGFNEVERGLNRRQAVMSAKRCFNCGICSFCANCYEFCPDLAIHIDDQSMEREIDYDHCKGCGICVEECPRAAIRMVPE